MTPFTVRPSTPWRPHLGQNAAVVPAPTPAAAAAGSSSYPEQVLKKMLWFGFGAGFAYPTSLAFYAVVPSMRMERKQALIGATVFGTVGLIAVLLPIENQVMTTISRLGGLLMGIGLARATLPAPAKKHG